MDPSILPLLRTKASEIVHRAGRPGGALDRNEFTMVVARQELEVALGLEEGGLGSKEWKKVVKEVVHECLNELATEEAAATEEKAAVPANNPVQSESEVSPEKAKAKPSKAKKSATRVPSSDVESVASSSDSPKKASKPKRRPAKLVAPSSDNEEETKPSEPTITEPKEDGAESDMSSVYDFAPTRPKKAKGKGKKRKSGGAESSEEDSEAGPSKRNKKSTGKGGDTAGKRGRKAKDPNEGLSPDEAKIASLKKFIVACGVRKQWVKELADCTTTSSQISHLEGLLRSLGMKGNPTLGKAKSIKEKRELAAELEDVQQFEKERGRTTGSRGRNSFNTVEESVNDVVGDQSDSD
ncbi:hypothetical protein IAT38_002318 [Cryptococcus sp. DSM 104549]